MELTEQYKAALTAQQAEFDSTLDKLRADAADRDATIAKLTADNSAASAAQKQAADDAIGALKAALEESKAMIEQQRQQADAAIAEQGAAADLSLANVCAERDAEAKAHTDLKAFSAARVAAVSGCLTHLFAALNELAAEVAEAAKPIEQRQAESRAAEKQRLLDAAAAISV